MLAFEDDTSDLVTVEIIESASIAGKILMDEYETADKRALVELQE
jgi:hypothetical protein